MPDAWDELRVNLYWSANHEQSTWDRHGAALNRYNAQQEDDAFSMIREIQRHNRRVQSLYEGCRIADKGRFWRTAFEVWDPRGPQGAYSVAAWSAEAIALGTNRTEGD